MTTRGWVASVAVVALASFGSGCNNAGTPGAADGGGFWGNWLDANIGGEGGAAAPAPDSDGDGLSDAEEAALGSDPHNPDTDGDGWTDLEEVEGFTDPTKKKDHPYTGGWAMGACRHDLVATGDAVGDVTDNFELIDQYGDTVRLHDFCDREVLLVGAAFW